MCIAIKANEGACSQIVLEVLDKIALDTLYKTARAMTQSRTVRKKFQ